MDREHCRRDRRAAALALAGLLFHPIVGRAATDGADPAPAAATGDATIDQEAARDGSEGGLGYGAQVEINSRYAWRGLVLSDAPVLQPSAWVSAGGFAFTTWSNVFVGSEPAISNRFSEVDFIAKYDMSIAGLTAAPSVALYVLTDGKPITGEVGFSLTYSLPFADLVARQSIDVVDNPGGYYAEIGAMREQKVGRSGINVDGSALLGLSSGKYNRYYFAEGIEHGGPCALLVDAGVKYSRPGSLFVRAHVGYSALLDGQLRDAVGQSTALVAGLALGIMR